MDEEDIVERLLEMHGGVPESYVGKLRVEAANEIKRLRAERVREMNVRKDYRTEIERLRTAPWVFRCSCQIADKVAPECSARGWCKERKPLLAEIEP